MSDIKEKLKQDQVNYPQAPNINIINNLINDSVKIGSDVIKPIIKEAIEIKKYIEEENKKNLEDKISNLVRPSFDYNEINSLIKKAISEKKNYIVCDESLLEPQLINDLIKNRVITDVNQYVAPKSDGCFGCHKIADNLLQLNFDFKLM